MGNIVSKKTCIVYYDGYIVYVTKIVIISK